VVAAAGRLRPPLQLPLAAALGGDELLPRDPGPVPGAEVREACEPADDRHLHAPGGRGAGGGGEGPAVPSLPRPAHNWHFPVPSHARQGRSCSNLNQRFGITRVPFPKHRLQPGSVAKRQSSVFVQPGAGKPSLPGVVPHVPLVDEPGRETGSPQLPRKGWQQVAHEGSVFEIGMASWHELIPSKVVDHHEQDIGAANSCTQTFKLAL